MATPLLTTKLYIPPVRPNLVPRPHLIERLNAGLHRKLTLISAPAGFGKTTLLSEWIDAAGARHTVQLVGAPLAVPLLQRASHTSPLRVAWLSLDEGDNDPARFFAYLFAALAQAAPDLDLLALEMTPTLKAPSAEVLLIPLINHLTGLNASAGSARALSLVLDDYQVIQNAAIDEALVFLIDNAPPQLHLVIATRADPSFPLPRWRARQQLLEIRTEDLRFTRDETSLLLESTLGLCLSEGDLVTLNARAEGWIAALQLAALSMQGQQAEAVSASIHAFSGSHRHILDYLVQEVLQKQSTEARSFLLQTAILDRLTGALCDVVTGQNNGQALLARLERANLFVVALDDERRWYRYHRLFADFLRARLQAEEPEILPELHRRAAEWYEGEDLTAAAIHHALSARACDLAARLVTDACGEVLRRGEVGTIKHWIQALPEALVRGNPRLALARAWSRVITMDTQEMDADLDDLEHVLRTAPDIPHEQRPWLLAQAMAIRATRALDLNEVEAAIAYTQEALAQLPAENVVLRSVLAFNLANAHRLRGEVELARHAYEQAINEGRQSGNTIIVFYASYHLGAMHQLRGHLREAAAIYRQALALVETLDPLSPLVGMMHVGLGAVLWERFELDAAQDRLETGVDLCQQAGAHDGTIDGHRLLARIYQVRGEVAQAQAALKASLVLVRRLHYAEGDARATLFEVQYHLAQGDLGMVRQWVEHYSPLNDVSNELCNMQALMLAHAHLALGDATQALVGLSRLLQEAEEKRGIVHLTRVLVLQALAHHAQGETPRALATLERALELAEPEGHIRVFVEAGAPLGELLLMLRDQALSVSRKYIARLFNGLGVVAPTAHPSLLVESLTGRELDVLRLLPTEMTSAEIAGNLVISPHTARTHIKNIYGKLGVHGRYEAVERAKALSLL